MNINLTKQGMLIVASVLFTCLLFTGGAGAVTYDENNPYLINNVDDFYKFVINDNEFNNSVGKLTASLTGFSKRVTDYYDKDGYYFPESEREVSDIALCVFLLRKNQNRTLDLNGYTLDPNFPAMNWVCSEPTVHMYEGAKLTIRDSKGTGTIYGTDHIGITMPDMKGMKLWDLALRCVPSSSGILVGEGGTLILESGIITDCASNLRNGAAVELRKGANLCDMKL